MTIAQFKSKFNLKSLRFTFGGISEKDGSVWTAYFDDESRTRFSTRKSELDRIVAFGEIAYKEGATHVAKTGDHAGEEYKSVLVWCPVDAVL